MGSAVTGRGCWEWPKAQGSSAEDVCGSTEANLRRSKGAVGEAEGARSGTSSGTFKAERLVAEKRGLVGRTRGTRPNRRPTNSSNPEGVTIDRVIALR